MGWFWTGASAGSELVQPVNLLKSALLFQEHESYRRVSSLSHYMSSIPSIARNNRPTLKKWLVLGKLLCDFMSIVKIFCLFSNR